MSPEEVKALRKGLGCSARDLAAALEVTADVVLSWEKGELFPTKQYVDKLRDLEARGPAALPKRSKSNQTPMQLLADPETWSAFRKILAHAELRRAVLKLARDYDEP